MTTDLGFSTNVRIGSSVGAMEDVKIEPKVEFLQGRIETVVCGQDYTVGYPKVVWEFPDRRLTPQQYYQLYALVDGAASATVYMDVPTNEVDVTTYLPVIATYQAIMHWPEEGVKRTMYNEWEIEDPIEFTNLVSV